MHRVGRNHGRNRAKYGKFVGDHGVMGEGGADPRRVVGQTHKGHAVTDVQAEDAEGSVEVPNPGCNGLKHGGA